MKKFSAVLIAAVLALTSVAALAHSDGTDSRPLTSVVPRYRCTEPDKEFEILVSFVWA